MSTVFLAGTPFRINPDTVSGGFRANTSVTETQGGRVIQVFGTSFDDLMLTGSFGVGGFAEQNAFLRRMEQIARIQLAVGANSGVPFTWPDRGWNFSVMLKAYTSAESDESIEDRPDMVNPRWQLTLFIISTDSAIHSAEVAQQAFIARLAEGLGWKRAGGAWKHWEQTVYNGGLLDGAALGAVGDPTTTVGGGGAVGGPGGGGGGVRRDK
jgi:hypothetical protein